MEEEGYEGKGELSWSVSTTLTRSFSAFLFLSHVPQRTLPLCSRKRDKTLHTREGMQVWET